MNTTVIALLDKGWPPAHSFVDGMLATEAPLEEDLRFRLCVSGPQEPPLVVRRYKRAVCIPRLYPRRGFGRFKNLPLVFLLIAYQARRERERGRRVVVFVRNDPIYLLVASLCRRWVERVVFQSSFPHEETSGWILKRWSARGLYRLARRGVDVVTAVSPGGIARLKRLFPHAEPGPYIPLLSDLRPRVHSRRCAPNVALPKDVTFIYIGTHSAPRRMDVVLDAVVRAVDAGASGQFRFVGASEWERARLSQNENVAALVEQGVITIESPVPRHVVPYLLAEADVGLSLPPPIMVNREMSPTKLAEYMGAGLAVLASRGIPMQEKFVSDSDGGLLVDWDVESMSMGIQTLCSDVGAVRKYGENSAEFARQSLQYRSYLPAFRQLLGAPERRTSGG